MKPDYQQYVLKKKEKLYLTLGMGVFTASFSWLFYQNLILMIFFPLLYAKGKKIFAALLLEKRNARLLQEFRDFLFSLSATFSTGRHMTEAMEEAEDYLRSVYGTESLMAEELSAMLKSIEQTGESDLQVLMDFSQRAPLEDICTFVDVYRTCRETGGDLVSAVNKAASMISEKINLEMEIKTLLSQKKLEGRMIAAMPFLMIFFLLLMSPSYLEVMYTTLAGRLLMSVALGLNLFSLLWIERMTNVEI